MSFEHHHPHHEPHQTGHRWLDIGIAVFALIVSVASVAVTMIHGRTMERMADANARLVEANSWPFVDYQSSNAGPDPSVPLVRLTIENNGVGPAKIESVELSWRGISYPDGIKLLDACCGLKRTEGDQRQLNSVSNRVLRAGDEINFLSVLRTSANGDAFDRLEAARKSSDLRVRVCYCSVFDECWESDTATPTLRPERIAECKAPPVSYDTPR